MKLVKHGPRCPSPHRPLSKRSLRLINALFITHEANFLLGEFLALYPKLSREDAKTQGVGFEVLCLAADLKECVLLGWGDGRDEQGDGNVAVAWLELVWEKVKADLTDLLKESSEARVDVEIALDWMRGVQIHKIGQVEGESAVFTGHYLLYHPPASPALQDLLVVPTRMADHGSRLLPVITSENIWAYVLDYPTTMPANENFLDDRLRRQNVVQVNIHQMFQDGPVVGTEYFASPSASDMRKIKAHYSRYRSKLKGVAHLALLLNGKMEDESDPATSTLQQGLDPLFHTILTRNAP